MYNNPPKITKKKKIELIVLIVVILWFILLGINYLRYTKNLPLFLSIHRTYGNDIYPDGTVTEYISLGYTYRIYNTASISREEFVPIWKLREPPQVKADLPKVETGYNIPDNGRHQKKYMGLLYYYDAQNRNLLGTYKCINSVQDCDVASTGWDRFDIINKDPITRRDPYKFNDIHEKYAFIDDSPTQDKKYGDNGYVRIIYLYKFDKNNPEILAKYSDIKETAYNDIYNLANYDTFVYIVKNADNNKWGIIRVTKDGEIEEKLPFEYDSITYDYDTKYYIVCKNDLWYAYDLESKKAVSVESVDVIYDVWKNANNSYYFKTGKETSVNNENMINYAIYRFDGVEFLKQNGITEIVPRRNYVMYLTASDNKLHFMTYSKAEKYTIQLYFNKMEHDEFTHPAFEIFSETDISIAIKVFEGRLLKYDYDVKTVFTTNWEFNEE